MEVLKCKNAPKLLQWSLVTKHAIQKMKYFPYLHFDCFQTWHKSNLSSPPTIKTILSEIPAMVQKLLSLRFEKCAETCGTLRQLYVNSDVL